MVYVTKNSILWNEENLNDTVPTLGHNDSCMAAI